MHAVPAKEVRLEQHSNCWMPPTGPHMGQTTAAHSALQPEQHTTTHTVLIIPMVMHGPFSAIRETGRYSNSFSAAYASATMGAVVARSAATTTQQQQDVHTGPTHGSTLQHFIQNNTQLLTCKRTACEESAARTTQQLLDAPTGPTHGSNSCSPLSTSARTTYNNPHRPEYANSPTLTLQPEAHSTC